MLTFLLAIIVALNADPDLARYASVKGVTLPQELKSESLSGEWYRGDGLGYNIQLMLNRDGTYHASWRGCLGLYGTARGTWTLARNIVTLTPVAETGQMVGHVRRVLVVMFRKRPLLVPEGRQGDFFVKHGPSKFSCFSRPDDPG